MPPCALRVRPSRGPISLLRTWKQPSVRFGGSVTARAAPRPRVVVDTGVVVSAFAFGGVPARALRAALSTSDVCVSGDLLAEYRNIPDALRAARKVNAEQWQALLAGIAAFVAEARLIEPTRLVRVLSRPQGRHGVGMLPRRASEFPDHRRPRPAQPRCVPDRRTATVANRQPTNLRGSLLTPHVNESRPTVALQLHRAERTGFGPAKVQPTMRQPAFSFLNANVICDASCIGVPFSLNE